MEEKYSTARIEQEKDTILPDDASVSRDRATGEVTSNCSTVVNVDVEGDTHGRDSGDESHRFQHVDFGEGLDISLWPEWVIKGYERRRLMKEGKCEEAALTRSLYRQRVQEASTDEFGFLDYVPCTIAPTQDLQVPLRVRRNNEVSKLLCTVVINRANSESKVEK
jgi:hypothetical protein